MNVIGIDVSKAKLDMAWLKDVENQKTKNKVFGNQIKAFPQLIEWVEKNTSEEISNTLFVMEATGVYHEAVAYYLFDAGAQVAVVNPAQIHHYGKALAVRTKNDKKDSVVLARFGATQSPALWKPEPQDIRLLKALLARLDAVSKDVIRESNRQEKAQVSDVSPVVNESIETMMTHLNAEKQRLEKLIDHHIDGNPDLKKDAELLKSIPGVGDVVMRYMMMTYRSRNFRKASQMAAYLGLVPVERQSGSSLHGRSHLSKAGSGLIRSKLYMPAIVCAHHNPQAKALYERLLAKGKSKMSALGAVMRKIVQVCFGVLKHQQVYSPQAA